MGRLRATLARSALDRTIQGNVSAAEKALRAALRACADARGDPKLRPSQVNRVRRDLEHALGALQGVRCVVSPYDVDDPDLRPDPDGFVPNKRHAEPEPEPDPEEDVEEDVEDLATFDEPAEVEPPEEDEG